MTENSILLPRGLGWPVFSVLMIIVFVSWSSISGRTASTTVISLSRTIRTGMQRTRTTQHW